MIFPFLGEKIFCNNNANFFLATYCGLRSVLHALYKLSQLFLTATVLKQDYYYPHFTEKDTEVRMMEYLPITQLMNGGARNYTVLRITWTYWQMLSWSWRFWKSSKYIYIFSFLLDPFLETILRDMQKSVRMHSQLKS